MSIPPIFSNEIVRTKAGYSIRHPITHSQSTQEKIIYPQRQVKKKKETMIPLGKYWPQSSCVSAKAYYENSLLNVSQIGRSPSLNYKDKILGVQEHLENVNKEYKDRMCKEIKPKPRYVEDHRRKLAVMGESNSWSLEKLQLEFQRQEQRFVKELQERMKANTIFQMAVDRSHKTNNTPVMTKKKAQSETKKSIRPSLISTTGQKESERTLLELENNKIINNADSTAPKDRFIDLATKFVGKRVIDFSCDENNDTVDREIGTANTRYSSNSWIQDTLESDLKLFQSDSFNKSISLSNNKVV